MRQEFGGWIVRSVQLMPQWQSWLSGIVLFLTAMILSVAHWSVKSHTGTWSGPNELLLSTGLSVIAVTGFGIACVRFCNSAIGGALLSSAAFLSNGGIAVMSGHQLVPAASAAIALGAASIAGRGSTGLCALAIAVTCSFAGSQIALVVIVPLALSVAWLRQSRSYYWVGICIVGAGVAGTLVARPVPLIGDVEFATLHSMLGAIGTGAGVGLVLASFALAVLAPMPWRNGGAACLVLATFVAALVLRAPLLACLGLAIFAAHMAREVALARGPGIEIVAGIAAILPSAPYVFGITRSFGTLIVPLLSAPSPLVGAHN